MSTKTISVEEAAGRLAELVHLALQGEEIILSEDETPLIRLVPVTPSLPPRVAGLNRGEVWISDDFDEPLPDEFWMGNG